MWIPDIETRSSWSVVAHTFNPSTLGGGGRQISEIEALLVYRVSSRTARAIQRQLVSKIKKKTKNKTNRNQPTKENKQTKQKSKNKTKTKNKQKPPKKLK